MITEIIKNIAEGLELTNGEAAQLLSSLFTLSVGLLALAVSLIGAWLTSKTVKELRASREQSVRPVLNIKNSKFSIKLDRQKSLMPEAVNSSASDPNIIVKNEGLGPAIDAYISFGDFHKKEQINIDALNSIFVASGIHILKSNYGFELRDRTKSRLHPQKLLSDTWPDALGIDILAPNENSKLNLGPFLIQSLFLNALSKERSPHGMSLIRRINVTYSSLSGKKYNDKYYIFLSARHAIFAIGEPVGQFGKYVNWQAVEIEIRLSTSRITTPQAPWTIWLTSLNFRMRRRLENLKERFFNLFPNARQRFKVGDVVSFKPIVDWDVDEESNPYSRPRKKNISGDWSKAESDDDPSTGD
ncbi:hypothetical protein [Alteriqipengyuania sp. 357]